MDQDKQIFLSAQKDPNIDIPKKTDLYSVGTLATILQMLRLPDGTVKVLVEGAARARMRKMEKVDDYYLAHINILEDSGSLDAPEVEALLRSMFSRFEQLVKVNKKIPAELIASLERIDNAGRLADSIAAHMTIKLGDRQKVLELIDVRKRLELLHEFLSKELDLVEVEKRLQGRVKKQVEKSWRARDEKL